MYRRKHRGWIVLAALFSFQGIACDGSAPTNPPPSAAVSLSITTLNFSREVGSTAFSETFSVRNSGEGSLDWSATSSAPWLSIAPGSGTASSGQSAEVTVSIDASDLAVGTHTATITVTGTGISNSPQSIVVTLVLTAAEPIAISASETSLTFQTEQGAGDPAPATVTISELQGRALGQLSLTAVSYAAGADWLTVSLDGASAPATLSVQPTANPAGGPLAPGTYNASLRVQSPEASADRVIDVEFTVTAAPAIGLSSTSAMFDVVFPNTPAPSTVSVSNVGGGSITDLAVGTITYGPGDSDWLTATLDTSTAPATLTLAPDGGAIDSVGTYTATVPIESSSASNSPQQVTVTFTLRDTPPEIVLTPSSVTFAAGAGGANPPADTVRVTNLQGGTLDLLSVGTITYGAGASGWLTATLASTAADTDLVLVATTGSLAAGSYTATVPVQSPAASNSPQSVTVTFDVSAAPPAIALTPATVTFGAGVGEANPPSQTVRVTNAQGGTLDQLSVGTIMYGAGASGWLTATLASPVSDTDLVLVATTGSLPAGSYTATVPVQSPAASNSPQNVTVTFDVAPPAPAVLSLSRLFIADTIAPGDTVVHTVEVTNGGGGDLGTLSSGSPFYLPGGTGPGGWMSVSLDRTTAPATLTVTLTGEAVLAGGSYTATVRPTATNGAAPNQLQIDLTITGSPPPAPSISYENIVGRADVPINATDLVMGFSEVLDSATVSSILLELWNPASGGAWESVPATVTYNTTTGVLGIFPDSEMIEFWNEYRVRVTTGVRSAIGVPFARDTALVFTTEAVSDRYWYSIESVGVPGQYLGADATPTPAACALDSRVWNWHFVWRGGSDYEIRSASYGNNSILDASAPPSPCMVVDRVASPPSSQVWAMEKEFQSHSGAIALRANSDLGRRLDASLPAGPGHQPFMDDNNQVWKLVRRTLR